MPCHLNACKSTIILFTEDFEVRSADDCILHEVLSYAQTHGVFLDFANKKCENFCAN